MSITNFTPTDAAVGATAPLFPDRLGARFLAVVKAMANASHGMKCASEAERLFSLSDTELARRGITREGIIRFAFRGYI
jgi:hypothetical protein